MAKKITREAMIGFSETISKGVEIACRWQGMTVSAFVRQAVLEKLIAMGIVRVPAFKPLDLEQLNNSPPPANGQPYLTPAE
jgi:hypothetical protein